MAETVEWVWARSSTERCWSRSWPAETPEWLRAKTNSVPASLRQRGAPRSSPLGRLRVRGVSNSRRLWTRCLGSRDRACHRSALAARCRRSRALVVRHRVLERVVGELVASGELERLLSGALASPQTLELTDRVLASEETQHALRAVASSPEVRHAIARQTTGLADEVADSVREVVVRLDDRVEHAVSRLEAPRSAALWRHRHTRACACRRRGIGDRSPHVGGRGGRARDVPCRRPAPGMAGRCTARGELDGDRRLVLRALLERGGADSRYAPPRTPCAHHGRRRPLGRPFKLQRMVGLVLSIALLFVGFVPVLFDDRRRGLADFIAGTTVLYDGT